MKVSYSLQGSFKAGGQTGGVRIKAKINPHAPAAPPKINIPKFSTGQGLTYIYG